MRSRLRPDVATLRLEFASRQHILHVAVFFISAVVLLSGCIRLRTGDRLSAGNGGGAMRPPLSVTIALNKTLHYHSRCDGGVEGIPYLVTEDGGDGGCFDVVIQNISTNAVRLGYDIDSPITLRVTDSAGVEHVLSERCTGSFGSTLLQGGAHVLEPMGCLVYRVNPRRYAFPRELSGQLIGLQAVYNAHKKVWEWGGLQATHEEGTGGKRKVDMTKELGLWHGEARSATKTVHVR